MFSGLVRSADGFLDGAGAVSPLVNVRVGVTIRARAQQKWMRSEPVDWQKHQPYSRVSKNVESY
uniref:Uncharacterized protein n=1 Tax=Romanomermis culicivorax TaxID=13658 RepID=A0A915J4Z0_ROMCU